MIESLHPFTYWLIAFRNEMLRYHYPVQVFDYLNAIAFFESGWPPDDYAHALLEWRK